MAESDSAKKLTGRAADSVEMLPVTLENAALNADIPAGQVMTGGDNPSRFLLYALNVSTRRAKQIDFIVSFLMESGVRLLISQLRDAADRGVPIRILTGSYLNITQPSALYLLKQEFGDSIDLRFYREDGRSFHAKSYIFRYDTENEIYVGSSNLSRSALTSGIEWNYRFTSRQDNQSFQAFSRTFEDLFYHHSEIVDDALLRRYAKGWHRPAVYSDLERYDRDSELLPEWENSRGTSAGNSAEPLYRPRGAQLEALYALNQTREEGADKALIQAATGVGKTYLAAFDSVKFGRVLFVAHRKEILGQAERSFRNVRPSDSTGFFDSTRRDTGSKLIFASVETLGQPKYLNEKYFRPDAFDYIVIDEFHHAVTKRYQNIIGYFRPKFLLGLTATPERMDGRNIYEICDYNVPYELSLRDAINRGFLCPFHYYGIFDETDYSGLQVVRGRYREEDLNRIYLGNARRADLIYRYYQKYGSRRALGFCCSRRHAEFMAGEFSRRGVRAAAVYSGESGEYALPRDTALQKLRSGEVQILFSVDMFNEGLDIQNVDMVLFLRPTDSPVVFLQQLGRGLRRAVGKEYLNILDFIGNYERAGQAPALLAGKDQDRKQNGSDGDADSGNGMPQPGDYPDGCFVDFDMRLIDLFQAMRKRSLKVAERIDAEVDRIRGMLGDGRQAPTRMDLFTYMDADVYSLCLSKAGTNLFRDYLAYKKRRGWLTSEEEKIAADPAGSGFLRVIAQTSMSKVYKMPILAAFYNNGEPRMEVTDEDVLAAWKAFFNTGTNWKDFDPSYTREQYLRITDKAHLKKAHSMPIHFLLKNGGGYFVEKEGYALALREDLRPMLAMKAFRRHFGDIIQYRTMDYFRRRYTDRNDS